MVDGRPALIRLVRAKFLGPSELYLAPPQALGLPFPTHGVTQPPVPAPLILISGVACAAPSARTALRRGKGRSIKGPCPRAALLKGHTPNPFEKTQSRQNTTRAPENKAILPDSKGPEPQRGLSSQKQGWEAGAAPASETRETAAQTLHAPCSRPDPQASWAHGAPLQPGRHTLSTARRLRAGWGEAPKPTALVPAHCVAQSH